MAYTDEIGGLLTQYLGPPIRALREMAEQGGPQAELANQVLEGFETLGDAIDKMCRKLDGRG